MAQFDSDHYTGAEDRLRAIGGYDWLLDERAKELWSAREVADALTAAGLAVSYDTVARWFTSVVVTTSMQGKGRVASRRALVLYFLSTANDEWVRSGGGMGGGIAS